MDENTTASERWTKEYEGRGIRMRALEVAGQLAHPRRPKDNETEADVLVDEAKKIEAYLKG